MAEELTPMTRQYLAIKREIPEGAILMFRLGDFYEMFGDDAVRASPILGATLTHRNNKPMCGVPYHAINSYLAKLIRAGLTAALCDQVEDPKTAKGLVRREVTRIVTPGTVTEDGLLDETANNYVGAVNGRALALLDLATGEFLVEEYATDAKLDEALEIIRPAEMLKRDENNEWTYSYDAAYDCLTRHFKVLSLEGFGLMGKTDAICAAGALLYYVGTTLHHSLGHIRRLRLRNAAEGLVLDGGTIRHLQLLPGGEVTRQASLLGVLDMTKTPMGGRTLRNWIARPLARVGEINARLDAVGAFVENRAALSSLRILLADVRDLERLVQKVDSGRANPRDMRALASSLLPIRKIRELLAAIPSSFLADCLSRLSDETELAQLINEAIIEEPPVLLVDGGFIADGYNDELDEIRDIAQEGNEWLANYQAKEQERTGILKLKVKHVATFGFVIEIPKGSVAMAPADYERRQTLTTGERYTTPELKEYEHKVLGAQERGIALEQSLYRELLARAAARTAQIQMTAAAIGELDVILSFADRALAAGYVRPTLDESDVLSIKDGRHPIIEQLPDAEPFVPNSTFLNCTTEQIHLITGPNMAGKSTYIRQVATLVIMAQAGSWVSAAEMHLGVVDRVFTRIGAGDDLARGRSTFLVEMQETANILNNATPRSLVILDEIGRGTSTFDGISIAWSVAEYLYGKTDSKAKTLFATHYHELTDLAKRFDGIKNYTVKVKEEGNRVVFLRRIVPGVAEKSFGIHVGAMAGLPPEVVKRAGEILSNLESNVIDVDGKLKVMYKPRRKMADVPGQMTFL